jgi:NADH-quinone oxidoreductase subunit M
MDQFQVAMAEKAGAFLAWLFNPISQLVFWPLLGCILICLIPPLRLRAIRAVALVFSSLSLLTSILMLTGLPAALTQFPFFAQFQPFRANAQGFQFMLDPQKYKWLAIQIGETQSFSVNWNVGVDGLSMPMLLLTTVLSLLCVIWATRRTERIREFFALTLLLECALLGIFCALDYVLFYLFWEMMLIPMFFLIAGWGRDKQKAARAAIKFFIYTIAGSVFYLISFIVLQIMSGVYSFSIGEILNASLMGKLDYVDPGMRLLIFGGLLLGFAVKIPMFPFHTWLPDAHTEAPTEMSVLLAGVMLKTGAYAFLRILYSTLPGEAYQYGPIIAFCGVAAIVYGAGVTLVQTDIKRMVAYSSISHMGFIVLGISSMNMDGAIGAAFHMVAHGVIIGALFFLCGAIEERYGTRDLRQLAGLLKAMPSYGFVLGLAAFASMGFPLLAGFWGEFLILKGAFFNNPQWRTVSVLGLDGSRYFQTLAVIAVLGILATAVYMINMLQRVLPGEAPARIGVLRGFRPSEAPAMLVLAAALLLLFAIPGPLINSSTIYAAGLWQSWLLH